MSDWFADAGMWEAFAPAMFTDSRLSGTAAEVDGVIKLLQLEPGERILDLCCGQGRHSLELARRGYRVTGVDLTQAYIDAARAGAAREALDVEFVVGDAREFRRPGAFDAVISMYTSFGYFEAFADDLVHLTNAYQSLGPGGRMLLDTLGKEPTIRRFTSRSWVTHGDDFVLTENVIVGAWERIILRWIRIHPDGGRDEASLNIRLYSAVEMAAATTQAGFDSISVYGDLAGRPFDGGATQMVAVVRRGS